MQAPKPKKRSGLGKGLGKGFDALLPANFDESILLGAADRVEKVSTNQLVPNRYQPRTEFNDEALTQLAASIKQYGVLQPIVATRDQSSGEYMIIAGERRWRASKLAGLGTVPVIVRSAQDLEQLELALIENVQRVDLSPLEQAASIEYLHSKFNTSYEQIAKRLGKGQSTVINIVRLLQLPEAAAQALRSGEISEGHARAILALKSFPEKQTVLLKAIMAQGWTVRQAEQFVVSTKAAGDDAEAEHTTRARMRTETDATKALSKRLGVPVFIRRTAKGGKLELGFGSDDELNTILSTLSSD